MSSSKPTIVIAPKKKKKKPLLIVSKKKQLLSTNANDIDDGACEKKSCSSSRHQPPSPNTVVAADPTSSSSSSFATTTNATSMSKKPGGGSNRKSSKHGGGIIIKPFTKPPELPTDFYDTSLDVLSNSLICVLRHEKVLVASGSSNNSTNNESNNNNERLVGREELYRSVEDLCVHKLGTKLYYDVVTIIERAASEIVRRLASAQKITRDESSTTGGSGSSLDAIIDNMGNVGYNSTQLITDLNLKDGGVCNSSNDDNDVSSALGGGGGNSGSSSIEDCSSRRYALLQRMHDICRQSYADEYLTFVRSIFLALDRAYVYYANVELEDIVGNCNDDGGVLCQDGGGSECSEAMDIDTPSLPSSSNNVEPKVSSSSPPSPPGGKVVERSSASSNNPRVWGLWEVGIACLRQHMVRCPASIMATTTSTNHSGTTLSVLTTMILTTAYAVLSEYDNQSSSYSVANMGDSRSLVRNCVRTIIDLGSLPALLEELIIVASARFEKEGMAWGMSLNEGKKSAPEFLLHVEQRLKQSGGLAGYYLPGNAESVNALRRLSKLSTLRGAAPSLSSSSLTTTATSKKVITWSPSNNSTRRIFPAIIEKQLLGPHLLVPNAGIFEPRHLYPILDDHNDSSGPTGGNMAWKTHSGAGGNKTYENAKRLYGLCWRMTQSTSSPDSSSQQTPASSSSGGNKPPSSALDLLRQAFGEYGRIRGTEIIKQGLVASAGSPPNVNTKEMEKKIIPDLLAFKNHLYALHEVAFHKEDAFGAMVRSILDDVLNGSVSNASSMSDEGEGDGGRRIAELLAKHVDMRFKDTKASASTAATSSDANESFQKEILVLFRHINSKDVFEAFCKRDLAKRLLTGRAVSTDMERSFLSKLKAECGAGYTSKMEGMFKDMDLSRDIMGSYAAYSAGAGATTGGGKTVDMDVQVLTTGYWPVYPKYPNLILPPEMLALRTKFESYYNDKYQGRRIAWQYSLGNCIVKASFPKSAAPKELIVNVCQSLVLLCFKGDEEDKQGLTLDEIAKRTGIDDKAELERVLQSLSMGRDGTRVLKKKDYDSPTQPASPSKASMSKQDGDSPTKAKKRMRRNVGPHDRFFFNANFTSNQRRIRITNITMKETSEERTKTHAAVSKDRLYFIDAAVVRIMKARKTIEHRGLIGEVMAQLKFPVTAADIKKRVESLIEREYMERVEGDRSKYKYLA